MLIIDNEPIRRKALEEYHRIEQELAEAQKHIEAFESGDLPAYQRWEAQLFGSLLTDLRAALQACDEKRQILLDVEEEMFWGRCSPTAAYRRVMKRRESSAAEAEETGEEEWQQAGETGEDEEGAHPGGARLFGDSDLPPDFDIEEFDRMTPRKQQRFRNDYRMLSMMYEMMTGNEAPNLDELLQRERMRKGKGESGSSSEPASHSSDKPKLNRQTDRLKELYRKLVRQLHPDSAQELTEREKELWHEVQDAYRARDLERMEAVAGRIEIGSGGSAANLPLQIILRMTQDLHDALIGLELHIGRARKHPAWLFRNKTQELVKMEKKHRRALTADLKRVTAELAELTDHLAEISSRPKEPRRRAGRKKAARYVDEPFF